MDKLTVEDLDVNGKRVLMRVDFNVPLEGGRVVNDKRIRAALPTINTITRKGGKLILMSHLGRPKGKRVPEMSLEPCVTVLNALLGRKTKFVDDCLGPDVDNAVGTLGEGEILLLQNLRYYQQETENDPDFAARLAKLGDVYVNDAFGTAHRAHASTEGVTHYIDQCAAGYLLMKEIAYLGGVLQNPDKPFVAILGGAKISGKIDIIASLLPRVDTIIIGGGLHPPLDHEGRERVVPGYIAPGCRIIAHDALRDPMVDYGLTSRKTPVRINADFAGADFKIVIGQIDPHQFVGFTGGAKGVVIGCAASETIEHNHSLMFHEGARVGQIAGNPVREDLNEAGEMVGIQLALNVVLNAEKNIVEVNPALCKGCGACAATCPSEAVTLLGFSNKQIYAQIKGALAA